MKVVGAAAVPDTVAVPLLAADETLQTKALFAVSASVAPRVGAAHAVGEPSSDIVTVRGPAPWVITGASSTPVTVTFTVIKSVSKPSETWTAKLSVPLKSASGA